MLQRKQLLTLIIISTLTFSITSNMGNNTVESKFEESTGKIIEPNSEKMVATQLIQDNSNEFDNFEESSSLVESVEVLTNKPVMPQLTPNAIDIDTPGVLKVIIKNGTSGKDISYGWPGMSVDVSVLVKGPFSNRDLKVELKRDIALGSDTVLGSASFSSITMLNTDEIWFNVTGFTLDSGFSSFGFSSGSIRKYYVQFIDTTPFPDDVIFRGGDIADGGTGTGLLYMRGSLLLEGIQYYNVSTSTVPIQVTEPDWILVSGVALRIINGPLWDFSVFVNFKYDVKFGIDVSVSTNQIIGLFPISDGVYLPGMYEYLPIDTNLDPAILALDTGRTYGEGIGDTRNVFGVLQEGDEIGSNLNDVDNLISRDTAEIKVLNNIVEAPPKVEFLFPTDGDLVDNDIISVEAKIEDSNTNYLIESILLNNTEVINDYHPVNGTLSTTFDLSGYSQGDIIHLFLTAIDEGGLSSTDIVYIQVYDSSGFILPGYSSTTHSIGEKLYDDVFSFSESFNYVGESIQIEIKPVFSIGFAIESLAEVYISVPTSVESGELATIYSSASNPRINTYLNISLDIEYSFVAGDLSFAGSHRLYFDEFSQDWFLPHGIFTFDLEDLLGKEISDRLTKFDLDVTNFIPQISWLVDLVFSLDIQHTFKQIGSLSANIDVTNGTPTLNSIIWTDSSLKAVSIQVDITDGSTLDVQLNNFEYSYRFGIEVYFQFYLSGSIAGFELFKIDLNEWMAKNLGIIIPKIDMWLIEFIYQIPGTSDISVGITPRTANGVVLGLNVFDTSQNLTVRYSSYGSGLDNPTTISAVFMGVTYFPQSYGDGYYQFHDIALNTVNETIYITMSHLGYETIELEFFIETRVTEVLNTVTDTVTSVSTIIVTTVVGDQTTTITSESVFTSFDTTTETETETASTPWSILWIMGFVFMISVLRTRKKL